MKSAPSLERTTIEHPKWLWAKGRGAVLFSMLSAFVAAVGFQVEPKALIRPILASAGFYEISVNYTDTEAVIKTIQKIDRTKSDHPLIKELRRLSKETDRPFQGQPADIELRLSKFAPEGPVGVVCRNSELRDTYLQFLSAESGLVILKVVDAGACNQARRDEVQVHPDTWKLIITQSGRTREKLQMDVLLHRPAKLAQL